MSIRLGEIVAFRATAVSCEEIAQERRAYHITRWNVAGHMLCWTVGERQIANSTLRIGMRHSCGLVLDVHVSTV